MLLLLLLVGRKGRLHVQLTWRTGLALQLEGQLAEGAATRLLARVGSAPLQSCVRAQRQTKRVGVALVLLLLLAGLLLGQRVGLEVLAEVRLEGGRLLLLLVHLLLLLLRALLVGRLLLLLLLLLLLVLLVRVVQVQLLVELVVRLGVCLVRLVLLRALLVGCNLGLLRVVLMRLVEVGRVCGQPRPPARLVGGRVHRRLVEGGRELLVVRLGGEKVRRLAGAHLVLLLVFHAPILEPDFDLPLAQRQVVRYLDAAPSRQILVEVELLLQLQCLVPRVRLPRPLAAPSPTRALRLLHPWVDLVSGWRAPRTSVLGAGQSNGGCCGCCCCCGRRARPMVVLAELLVLLLQLLLHLAPLALQLATSAAAELLRLFRPLYRLYKSASLLAWCLRRGLCSRWRTVFTLTIRVARTHCLWL